MLDVSCTASKLVSGKFKSSATFANRTGFESVDSFLRHMKSRAEAIGMDMCQYGHDEGWVIEHTIPKEAYTFADPDDVRRCWSKSNVRAMCPKGNKEKGVTIVDELCIEVGAENYPASWNGQIPTMQEKESFYIACKKAWGPRL
jgi:hypothetical protein